MPLKALQIITNIRLWFTKTCNTTQGAEETFKKQQQN